MISLTSARARVLAGCARLDPRAVPLEDALGCATSVAIAAEEASPPFDNTAVDGYAVRAADTAGAPVELTVVDTLPAGAAPSRPVGPGEAIRIMTGAPIPPGADAVVMVEVTEALDGGQRVRIDQSVRPGEAVRPAGSDVAPGDTVLEPQAELTAAHLGLLASIGVRKVPVHRRARVGVLSTGDELVDEARPLRPGEIRDSNRVQLKALLRGAGCEPVDLGLVRDDEGAITAVIEKGVQECDALLTSGGVSMGDYDLIKVVLDRMGEMQWMQIAIKPAKPFAFGVVGGVPVFGLPGNSVSSIVSFELLARPALRQMMGHKDLDRPRVPAIADEAFRRRVDGKIHFVRVVAGFGEDGRVHVRSAGAQGSHQLAGTAGANGLAILPDGEGVDAGAVVDTLLLS